jgi:hypothetical protein
MLERFRGDRSDLSRVRPMGVPDVIDDGRAAVGEPRGIVRIAPIEIRIASDTLAARARSGGVSVSEQTFIGQLYGAVRARSGVRGW